MTIQQRLKQEIPDLVGTLDIVKLDNVLLISGNIYTSEKTKFSNLFKSLLAEYYPNTVYSSSLELNEFTCVTNTVETNKVKQDTVLDEVNILYYGYMSVDSIKEENRFRSSLITIPQNMQKIDNCVKVLNFISPIVLDKELKVIDGNKRLQLAKDNNIKKVLVVVIDDCEKKADFLRLVLNRSAEFQKWNYANVDDFVDNIPQAQLLLEPLGFFGRKLLPTSFFSNTVLQYTIDPFNKKQMQYKQEIGLAEWAKIRRKQMEEESKNKRTKKPKIITENTVSLFNLIPTEEDFLETYDIEKERDIRLSELKEQAEKITNYCDERKRKEIEEKGGVWQHSHKSSKQVAEDNRKEAIEFLQGHSEFTSQQKQYLIENIDEYAELVKNKDIEKLKDIFILSELEEE